MIHGKFDLHSHCFNVKVPQFGAPFIVPFDDPLRRDCNGMKFITWLILPVVICLSQRLSHACLSINYFTVKLRMAH